LFVIGLPPNKKLLNTKKTRAFGCKKHGIKMAAAKYIFFLDADD
jgi:hypothetical protein